MAQTDAMLTTGEVAGELNIQIYQLVYLLTTGQIPEPRQRAKGRRLWTGEEIKHVRRFLENKNIQDKRLNTNTSEEVHDGK